MKEQLWRISERLRKVEIEKTVSQKDLGTKELVLKLQEVEAAFGEGEPFKGLFAEALKSDVLDPWVQNQLSYHIAQAQLLLELASPMEVTSNLDLSPYIGKKENLFKSDQKPGSEKIIKLFVISGENSGMSRFNPGGDLSSGEKTKELEFELSATSITDASLKLELMANLPQFICRVDILHDDKSFHYLVWGNMEKGDSAAQKGYWSTFEVPIDGRVLRPGPNRLLLAVRAVGALTAREPEIRLLKKPVPYLEFAERQKVELREAESTADRR